MSNTLSEFPHDFPKGYKQYRIMKAMYDNDGLRYTDIIQLAYELSHGAGTFHKVDNRGYWSGAFAANTPGSWYGSKVDGWITKYCGKFDDGKYRVDMGEGAGVFRKLNKKFGGLTTKDAKYEVHKKNLNKEPIQTPDNFGSMAAQVGARAFNSMPLPESKSQPLVNTQVRLRGLKLDDKVAYRKVKRDESGVGTIDMIQLYGTNLDNCDELHIGVCGSSIPVSYVAKENKFYHAGSEIEIIKL